MLKLRVNPLVVTDLKEIRDYIAEDNAEYAEKIIKEIYGKFVNIQMFSEIGAELLKESVSEQITSIQEAIPF